MIIAQLNRVHYVETDLKMRRTFIEMEVRDPQVHDVPDLRTLLGKHFTLTEEFEDLLRAIPTKDLAGEIYRRENVRR